MTIKQSMSQLFSCPLPALTDDNLKKLEINPDERTEIERRFDLLQAQLKPSQVGGSPRMKLSQQEIAEINTRNIKRINEAVRMQSLRSHHAKGLESFLARDMAVVHNWLGMGKEFTEAGWVRESMNRIRRLWRGGVNDMVRRYGVLEYARKNYTPIVDMLKKKGLSQDIIDRITTDAAEKAFYPVLKSTQQLGMRGRSLLDQKYRAFIDSLYNTYKLSAGEVQQIVNAGEGMAMVYHRLATAMQDAGIDVQETATWGYFNRILSTDAERRYTWKYQDENHIRWNDSSANPVTESLLKSRSTVQYIVEDEALLDFVLRSIGTQDGQDPRYYYRLVSEEPDAGIADILDSNYGLAQVVGAMLEKRHPEVVTALMDSGLLSKTPYTTVETFEYMKESLQFPFENLREVFAVDWNVGLRTYREQLATIAEESGFTNLMVAGVINNGWGISAAERAQNAAKYAGWVPMREVINPRILSKSFQQYNPVIGSMYVHPIVAKLAEAQQRLVMSPTGMSTYARILNSINTRFKQLALATLEYIPRQVWQNTISVAAAGGNLARMPLSFYQMTIYEALAHRAPELAHRVFDNTVKRYQLADGKLLTQLELVRYLEDVGILSRFEPLTGTELNPSRYAPNGIRRQARYLAHTLGNQGIPRTVEEATELLGGLFDRAVYPIAWSNNLMNNVGVFNVIESTTRYRGDSSSLRSLIHQSGPLTSASLKQFDTVDEAVEHARQFFYFYDDKTYYDATLSNYVIPFWGFLSKNIPNVVRYAARHPNRFMAWQRMYMLANQPVQDEEWLNEGSVDEWLLHSNAIWFKVPGGREDGRDEYFAAPLESIDPLNSALNWVSAPAQSLAEMFGIWNQHKVETTRSRLSGHPWMSTGTNQALSGIIENTYPVWKLLAAEVSGEDLIGVPLDEGNTVDSFLGLRASPRLKLWLSSFLPILRTIDSANPGGAFGTPSTYDVNTGQWTLGEPSWAGVRRTSRDTFSTNNRFEWLRSTGIKVYPVDVYLNAGLTVDNLRIDLAEGKRWVARAREDALLMPPGRQQQERLAEVEEWEWVLSETRQDLINFEAFMKREGLNPKQAYDRLRLRNTRIGDLDSDYPESQPLPGRQPQPQQGQPQLETPEWTTQR